MGGGEKFPISSKGGGGGGTTGKLETSFIRPEVVVALARKFVCFSLLSP
jgi:hypothetical protein